MGKKISAREMSDYYKSTGEDDTSWIEENGEADAFASGVMRAQNRLDKMDEKYPKSSKQSVRSRAYSEKAKDFGTEGQAGYAKGGMAKDIPLPPRRPADLDSDQTTSSPDTGDNFYPMSDIPVDEEYQKKLEAGYKTPKKRYSPLKKADGGMVRGFGIAARGRGKGKMY